MDLFPNDNIHNLITTIRIFNIKILINDFSIIKY